MAVVWKVENGKLELVTRTCWDFETGNFGTAVEQLKENFDRQLAGMTSPEPPKMLPAADFIKGAMKEAAEKERAEKELVKEEKEKEKLAAEIAEYESHQRAFAEKMEQIEKKKDLPPEGPTAGPDKVQESLEPKLQSAPPPTKMSQPPMPPYQEPPTIRPAGNGEDK